MSKKTDTSAAPEAAPPVALETPKVDPLKDLWAVVELNPHYSLGLTYLDNVKPEWRLDAPGEPIQGAFLRPATKADLEMARGKTADLRKAAA